MVVTASKLKHQFRLSQHSKDRLIVTFTQEFEDNVESYFKAGMKGELVLVDDTTFLDVIVFHFSVSKFCEHNRHLEKIDNGLYPDGETKFSVGIMDDTPYFILNNSKIYFALDEEEHKLVLCGLKYLKNMFETKIHDAMYGPFAPAPEHKKYATKDLETTIRALKSLKSN